MGPVDPVLARDACRRDRCRDAVADRPLIDTRGRLERARHGPVAQCCGSTTRRRSSARLDAGGASSFHDAEVDLRCTRTVVELGADTAVAEREAARDRSALLEAQGDDANDANEKIVEIRKKVSG